MCKCPNGYECPECMFPKKPTPHKHAEVIKAWADGADIEFRMPTSSLVEYTWQRLKQESPLWAVDLEYRVKPEVKPDYSLVAWVSPYRDQLQRHQLPQTTGWDIRVICDGETGKLKSVQLI